MARSSFRSRKPPDPAPRDSRRVGRPAHVPLAVMFLAITMAGLAAYSNSFSGVFVFDDLPAIEQNENLRVLWPLSRAMSAPVDTTLSGRPVATLSFALDTALWGGSLRGFHATNLAIHLVAALFVFGLVERTLSAARLREAFGPWSVWLALVVALLFLVHPIQTGSVTYIVQRVESLMGLFYLATLYAAARALEPAGGRIWTGVSVATCALGMATKEVMVTAPLMVVLWGWFFAPEALRSRRPLLAALFSTWGILATLVAGGARSLSAGFAFPDWPWWDYLTTQAGVLVHYLRLTFLPYPLVLDYGWPKASLPEALLPGFLILGLLLLTLRGVFFRSAWAFAGAWFFLILAPTSSVLPIRTEIAAEHRMYLPVLGPITLAVLGLYALLRSRKVPQFVGAALAVSVIGVFSLMTYGRNADYQSYERIWSDTIEKRPRNARARNNLASSLLARGAFGEAAVHLRTAVEAEPGFAEAQANLGVALTAQGMKTEGAQHLRKAIEIQPRFADARRNLGENYAMQGLFADAVHEYSQALESLPDDIRLLNRLAWILATTPDDRLRDGRRALAHAERAVALTRRADPTSLDSLGAARAEIGDFYGAVAAVGEAVALSRQKGDGGSLAELMSRAEAYSQNRKFRQLPL